MNDSPSESAVPASGQTAPSRRPPPIPGNPGITRPPPPLPPPSPEAPASREVRTPPVGPAETLVVLLLTILADVSLYRSPGGTGAGCVLAASALGALACIRRPVRGWDLALTGLVAALAGQMFWQPWWLACAAGWLALLVLLVRVAGGQWHLPECLCASAWTLFLAPVRASGHFESRNLLRGDTAHPDAPVRRSARTLLIPLTVCGVFVFIFAMANPVVADVLRGWFGDLTFLRILTWIGWGLLFAALIRPAVETGWAPRLATGREALQSDGGKWRFDDYTVALFTLAAVNALFLAYNAMDAVYLYFRADLPAGITWTDYTHAGCGWLTLGLAVSSAVLGFVFSGHLNFHPQAGRLRFLAYLWAIQNGVLALGTMRRIQMYIDFSGLTLLRITGIYGSLVVVAGLLVMVRKIVACRSFAWLARRYVLVFAIGVCALALTPSGWLCSRYNVARVQEGKPRALRPIVQKNPTPDSLPPLIALLDYRHPNGDAARERKLRQGIAGLLGQELQALEERERNDRWSRRHLSARYALDRLRAARTRIEETAPRGTWHDARRAVTLDYDLSGNLSER